MKKAYKITGRRSIPFWTVIEADTPEQAEALAREAAEGDDAMHLRIPGLIDFDVDDEAGAPEVVGELTVEELEDEDL